MAADLFLLFITPAFWFGVIAGVVITMASAALAMLLLGWLDERAEAAAAYVPHQKHFRQPANDDHRSVGLSPRQAQATYRRIPNRNPLITGEAREWAQEERVRTARSELRSGPR